MSFDNQPKPTTPLAVTAPAFDSAVDPKTLSASAYRQRLVDQQWRDVVASKTNLEYPDSLNTHVPS